MSLRDQARAALQAIGASLGQNLTLDPSGAAVLEFGGDAQAWIKVSEGAGVVTLRVPLLRAFGLDRERLADAALRANLAPDGPLSGRLGMTPTDGEIVYRADLAEVPTAENMAGFLDGAMTTALALRSQLQAVLREGPGGGSAETPSDDYLTLIRV